MANASPPAVEDHKKVTRIMAGIDKLAEGNPQNRRRRTRVDLQTTLLVTLLANQGLPRIKITTHDLSVSGMGFYSRRPFTLGEFAVVHLVVPGFEGKLLLSRAVFCAYARATMHKVGVEFVAAVPCRDEHPQIPDAWLRKGADAPPL